MMSKMKKIYFCDFLNEQWSGPAADYDVIMENFMWILYFEYNI